MRPMRPFVLPILALALSACSLGAGVQPPVQQAVQPLHRHPSSGKIQHVVIIVQENRSFNDLFHGYPGATTANYGYTTSGQKVKLLPVSLATDWDLEHASWGFEAA